MFSRLVSHFYNAHFPTHYHGSALNVTLTVFDDTIKVFWVVTSSMQGAAAMAERISWVFRTRLWEFIIPMSKQLKNTCTRCSMLISVLRDYSPVIYVFYGGSIVLGGPFRQMKSAVEIRSPNVTGNSGILHLGVSTYPLHPSTYGKTFRRLYTYTGM